MTFPNKHIILEGWKQISGIRRLKEPFDGNSVEISHCRVFTLLETVPGCRTLSHDVNCNLFCRASFQKLWTNKVFSRSKTLINKIPLFWANVYFDYIKFNIWNCLTFLNKHLILEGWKQTSDIRRLIEPFDGNFVKFLTAGHLVYLRPCSAAGH